MRELKEMPKEIALICFRCKHLSSLGEAFWCKVKVSQCHSKRVREWRKKVGL